MDETYSVCGAQTSIADESSGKCCVCVCVCVRMCECLNICSQVWN